MGMWAARDKDETLGIHSAKPSRSIGDGEWIVMVDGDAMYGYDFYWHVHLGQDPFPELTWEDEPIPVEVVVKRRDLQ